MSGSASIGVRSRRRRSVAPAVVAAAVAVVAVQPWIPSAGAAQEPRSTLDGVYTSDQAARGRETYVRVCSQCHALDWYRGDVVRAWEGAPLYGLFEVISTTMPQDNPGSLRRRDYVDMLAYILELNGMPSGSQELSTGTSRLREILFRWSDVP